MRMQVLRTESKALESVPCIVGEEKIPLLPMTGEQSSENHYKTQLGR